MQLASLRDFALELAEVADAITLDRYGGPVPAIEKPDGSPVTEADRAVEAALRSYIAERYPHHALFGEEQGGRIDPDAPTWVIDPIDGTKNFMRGVPVFATLIALVAEGRAVVGVASAPALGERWDAAAGLGARRNGERVGVSAIDRIDQAHVLHGDADRFRELPGLWKAFGELHDEAWRMRGFGDYWNHLLVAAGAAEVAFERELAAWDIAAIECIVAEAGGRVSDAYGESVLAPGHTDAPNLVVTTNGVLHAAVLERLSPPLRES